MFQQTIIVGRFVEDPNQFNYGQEGVGARFRIAADSGRDQTTYYDCVAFGKNAENLLKFFKKGRPIVLTGRMENNNYEKDVNGTKVTNYGMNFVTERWTFAGDAAQSGGQQNQQQGGYQQNNQSQGGFQQQNQQQQQQQNTNAFSGFGAMDDDMPF